MGRKNKKGKKGGGGGHKGQPSKAGQPKSSDKSKVAPPPAAADTVTAPANNDGPADEFGLDHKAKGNELFVAKKYMDAIGSYKLAIIFFDDAVPQLSVAAANQLEKSKVYANMAECFLRLNEPGKAEEAATKSLGCDKTNAKAMYRRARARMEMCNFKGAMEDGIRSGTDEGDTLANKAQVTRELYGRIIDSYRLRIEDQYTTNGDVLSGTLYSGEETIPVRHFRGYLKLGLAQKAFPKGFTSDDLDKICVMSVLDDWYNIRYAVEAKDVVEKYLKQGKSTRDVSKLRELAAKVMGPIQTHWNYDSDDENNVRSIHAYMSDSTCSDDESYEGFNGDKDTTTTYPLWLYRPPFFPVEELMDDSEFQEERVEFARIFNLSSFPFDTMSRLEACAAKIEDENSPIHKFFQCILNKNFGRAANNLSSVEFLENLKRVQIVQWDLLNDYYPRKMRNTEPAKGPKDWHFDHYGLVCSVVAVAYQLLSKEEQEKPDVQSRLTTVMLSGEEDILTGVFADCYFCAATGDDDILEDMLPCEVWDGPDDSCDKPESWQEGGGTELMDKAWDLWMSIYTAKLGANRFRYADPSSNPAALLEDVESLLGLPCFSSIAINAILNHDDYDLPPWDAHCDMVRCYAHVAEFGCKSYFAAGRFSDSFELAEKASNCIIRGSALPEYRYPDELVSLEFSKIRALVALEYFRDAEYVSHMITLNIEGRRKQKKNPLLYEDILSKVKVLTSNIALKCGPAPNRTPIPIEKAENWWHFDASVDRSVKNAGKKNEVLSLQIWNRGGVFLYPHVTHLHLDIAGYIGIEGMHNLFPCLKKLVIDDSKETLRCGYNLGELSKYASTLEYLELNLSFQWMAEGDDVLAPVASLVNLKKLRIQRRRDGDPRDLKHLESLTKLERLYFWGTNRLDYLLRDDSDEESLAPNYVLDFSAMKNLHSVVFIETSFCHISEKDRNAQALVLPERVQNVACVDQYGSKWSDLLFDSLEERGVTVYKKSREEVSEEVWEEIDSLYGGWISLNEQKAY